MNSPDDVERQIDERSQYLRQKVERYQQLNRHLAKVSASATVANGAISVTVGQSGLLTKLELTDQIHQLPGSYVAEQIMTAIRKAQSTLGPQIIKLMQTTVPEDTISIQTVQENYARLFPPLEPWESFDDIVDPGRSADEILKDAAQDR